MKFFTPLFCKIFIFLQIQLICVKIDSLLNNYSSKSRRRSGEVNYYCYPPTLRWIVVLGYTKTVRWYSIFIPATITIFSGTNPARCSEVNSKVYSEFG